MADISRRYLRRPFPALVYCGTTRIMDSLIRDEAWEDFDDQAISSYLTEGSDMLVSSLTSFLKTETPYSSLRAKELRFMLEALLEVKEVFFSEGLRTIQDG
jgi:hypothetical protein